MLKAREAVRRLPSYRPPLGKRRGLRLDFNENTAGCSPRVVRRLRSLDGEAIARYPGRKEGEALVAAHVGVAAGELVLTNGTDEAIHLVAETYLEESSEAIIVVPTFAMYEIYAAATGARVVTIPAAENFRFPTDAVLSAINSLTRLVAVANPNNPTGTLVSSRELARIAQSAPQAAILVDEAYFEFSGETMAPRWRSLANLFVTRTFSKAYGLAGLRIGVLMGHPQEIKVLRRAASPYNLNALALACLPEALGDQQYIADYVAQTLAGRHALERELENWDVRFWPSRANFVLIHLGARCRRFIAEMRRGGILVRDRSSDAGCKDCVRITVGIREHNERLLATLRQVFSELGIRERVRP